MRRVVSHVFTVASVMSLLLCAAVCVLWVRGRNGRDTAALTYDRYLPDRSAVSNQVFLTSDTRLRISVNWGRVDPYNGQNVWGYYVNADESGGRPRFRFYRDSYESMRMWSGLEVDLDDGATGWGPLRWESFSRSTPSAGERFRLVRMGISHWMVMPLLLVLPMIWIRRFRKARRASMIGLCPACGYDLRATPDRCPECGKAVHGRDAA